MYHGWLLHLSVNNDTILVGAATYLSYNGIGFHAKLGAAESKDLTHNDPNITLAGYSIAAGQILNRSPTDIVGAPRFMMKGAVLLYDDSSILPRKIIPGEQYFSGFGMDVGTGDFDNNGFRFLYC
ncbi:hypothetical protein HELRODRAFT_158963 [Helobdella robusta]|uniref:Uncharacterized protein n=1 Tax=Helobdella robusta TaxID=6412 RepID=T1ENF9_HELRO|nr:hypothetical protein HELRODRAFT_158963 [Helobdella robusta]ESO12431.1 hypothetical protein HELRODRAFT_158963 [Helobdella robusta]